MVEDPSLEEPAPQTSFTADEEIAAAADAVDGVTEMEALIAYLQRLGTDISKPAPAPASTASRPARMSETS
mgnify:CR=1 FL=1